MLDNFIYENHRGQRFVGLENNVYMNYSDLRDFSWSYDTINNRISRFYKGITDRKIPLIVHCDSEEKAIEVKNKLYEIAEVDIEAMRAGKIYIGDYYISGFITANAKSNFLISKNLCQFNLTLTSDNPMWYREEKHIFVAGGQSELNADNGTDYPYDYAYDYALSQNGKRINCDSVNGGAFKMVFYGAAENPSITIGGHVYKINGSIRSGEKLIVDSLAKTITLTTATGSTVNWFDKRNRDSYIFEPIASGLNTVTWNGLFGFDLTVIEQRSEPKWT